MSSFVLNLLDATHTEEIMDVTSFVGEDQTGSFGLQANHSRFMTVLSTGIAKYRISDGDWKYLAAAGGVIYFKNNVLTLCTYRFLLDDDYSRISQALERQLLTEKQKLQTFKESLHQIEEAVLMRLWEIGKREMI
ncbi:epsilon subunit [Vibrio sp. B1FLJ16]|uniref:F0F1 ATP synthase subunit epsilon n=1 Tax=Vibrio sp. B1FLJ16 TaxID=2751178 RepID=UPI0015F45C3E|nr:F0F1 ATP synthase subunit epsilon [Vibrio sp. B1FLJ16]CAD7819999.1 epsilon subunit [Vibrio sp. B1FLJ16]CAE6941385.1 epsilon subunit [Vibrio sp. B1FLJ16]